MTIRMSPNIDAPDCSACRSGRPWDETIRALEKELVAHSVTWPDFLIIHRRDLPCADASTNARMMNAGLYLTAVDAAGKEARHARVFHRHAKHFVGLGSVLDGSAFELEKLCNRCG